MARGQKRPPGQPVSPAELRSRLDFSDAQLLAECEVHVHRTGGPGGQRRNKVSTAVRLHHRASGLIAASSESRSQHENRIRALKRLRQGIALHARLPLPETFAWPATVCVQDGRLRVSGSNPAIHQVVALVLDALATCQGRLADAAKCLGLTTSSLKRFLREHPKAWQGAARICEQAGLPPIRA